MRKMVVIYGLILALAGFVLTWLDYRFWMRDIGVEVYGLALAIIFAGLGIWIERQRNSSTSLQPSGPNLKAIKALGLTRRETQMLDFLAKGKSNKEIARDLGLSPNTIKTHLANLYEKLGVRNRTQAVSEAMKLALNTSVSMGEKAEFTHPGE